MSVILYWSWLAHNNDINDAIVKIEEFLDNIIFWEDYLYTSNLWENMDKILTQFQSIFLFLVGLHGPKLFKFSWNVTQIKKKQWKWNAGRC